MVSYPSWSHIALYLTAYSLTHTTALQANSWQRRLDKALLSVDGITPQGRIRSIQRALRDPKLPKDVTRAVNAIRRKGFGKGHPTMIEALWPEGTIANSDIRGIFALTKSLPERVDELRDGGLEAFGGLPDGFDVPDAAGLVSTAFTRVVEDPDRAVRVAQNYLRSTPAVVDLPKYRVLRKFESTTANVTLEVRQYEDAEVVSVSLESDGYTLANMGAGLVQLSSYLVLGNNVGGDVMTMTSPFVMEDARMWINLPKDFAPDPVPEPKYPLELSTVTGRTLATIEFPGICTDGEIERQTKALMDAIGDDELLYALEDDKVQVIQYNSPGTLPWRRKNEIGIAVGEGPPPPIVEVQDEASVVESSIRDVENNDEDEKNDEDENVEIKNEQVENEEDKNEEIVEETGEESTAEPSTDYD